MLRGGDKKPKLLNLKDIEKGRKLNATERHFYRVLATQLFSEGFYQGAGEKVDSRACYGPLFEGAYRAKGR